MTGINFFLLKSGTWFLKGKSSREENVITNFQSPNFRSAFFFLFFHHRYLFTFDLKFYIVYFFEKTQ